MAPGGRFSGRLIWKEDCVNSGGLSLSSSTEHNTVAVPDRGREPLSRAWTEDGNQSHHVTTCFLTCSTLAMLISIARTTQQ